MALRFIASASPFCCVERPGQAVFLRQRGLVLVAHRLHDLADLALQLRPAAAWIADRIFTMSGCLSPSFSDSCACWLLQLRQLRLLLLDEGVGQDRRERVERRRVACDAASWLYIASFWIRSVFACVTAAFRSASFCTTMFSRSSSEIASFCSR